MRAPVERLVCEPSEVERIEATERCSCVADAVGEGYSAGEGSAGGGDMDDELDGVVDLCVSGPCWR